MLTRLQVQGFKNLVDVDVSFAPFTCIAGANGVGKSNLFDAILFLSALADKTLLEAVTGVRQETSSANAGRIFTRNESGQVSEMSLVAEMIVPATALDDLDQPAQATITTLRYALCLRLHPNGDKQMPRIELVSEELGYLARGGARQGLGFARQHGAWFESVARGARRSPFISTDTTPEGRVVKVHEDSGHQGRSRKLKAETLQRTLLSTINTAENPTALVARREMQSWRLLQLEPSFLRAPDDLNARAQIDENGRGLPATLNRLIADQAADAASVRAELTNRLGELVDDVRDVRVAVDRNRETLTLFVTDRSGAEFSARDLSDGTLRFLALSALQIDPTWQGVVCMEEPENGMHPARISAILELLQDIASDITRPVGDANPLRQVLVNTHSPELVQLAPEDAVLFAVPQFAERPEGRFRGVAFRPLDGTWRARRGAPDAVQKGKVLEYLRAGYAALARVEPAGATNGTVPVGLRPELQLPLPTFDR